MQAVIFGASGGIGRALVAQLAARPGISHIHAVSRSGTEAAEKITPHTADITSEADLAALATALKGAGEIALVIVATGLLSDETDLQPEKSYRHQSMDAFEQVFRANTFGPALLAKHMLPLMPRKGRAVFAALSARVGSITDNRLGGWHAYRASKAALNMLVRNYAIEQARVNDQFIAVTLHPGTVDTGLSRPFRSNVPDAQLFSPDQSADYLLKVIEGLSPADTGKSFDWAGKEIPA
ncbi:MAG: SDR family NAD(P)-dependent oxidoreductase [Hyphomonas oceanitis]|uniref:SDR family NAD(P)-dependent oxidoreductase n=1 Tax=Hyphomonas oceanitis TaxID=81033 RepID=UPI003002F068